MKKFLILSIFAFFLSASSASAMVCQQSMYKDEGESCWTKVTIASTETGLVSEGTVLVYELNSATPKQGSYQVRLAHATTDTAYVAGVAQQTIATSDSAMILVRGFGKVLPAGVLASGDTLYTTAAGRASAVAPKSSEEVAKVGFSLSTNASEGTDAIDAFITVV